MAAKTQRIGPFPFGMDNRAPDFKMALPKDTGGHLLRDAFNVDVTPQGTLKSRAGYALALAGADSHSAFDSDGVALYCDAGNVYRLELSGDQVERSLVASGYGALAPVRYARVNEAIYFTDGVRVGSYHPVSGPTPSWSDAAATTVGDQALVPMPPGSCIAHHGARLLVAVGSVLVYSEPFLPHLRDPARGFEMFPAPITCIAAVEGGVFVLADKTYFIAGGFPAQEVRAALPYGGPAQQAGYRDDGGAHWMSARGLCSCDKQGALVNLQEQHVAMAVTGSAATLFREADGMRAVVAALSEPSSSAAGVGSYAQARIVRKDP